MTSASAESWTELSDRLRRFVRRRVNDAHAAEDIAQDVLLKLREREGDLPPGATLPAWVLAVARNAVVDYYRARGVRHAEALDAGQAAAAPDGGDGDVAGGLAACLGRMVQHLPEPYREAMRLVDLEGLSQQALADRAGVSLSGAKSRVQRARHLLRDMIEDCCRVERDARGNPSDFETTDRSGRYCGDDDGAPRCGH
jgi:RNA polymerase sigma-70 factor (ECF subfamily)